MTTCVLRKTIYLYYNHQNILIVSNIKKQSGIYVIPLYKEKSDTVYEFWNIKTPSTRIRFQKELTASKTYIYALVRYIDLNLGRGPVKEVARRYQPTLAVYLKDLFCRLGQSQLSRNCELKITPIVVFAIMIQRIFSILSLRGNALYDCYSRTVDSFLFIN